MKGVLVVADEIKKVKIKDLPQTTSINDEDIFIESDSLETYKVTASDVAKYISTNENLTGKYIAKTAIGATNGIAPLNSNKKINGTYITYGTTSNTAYEGSNGKTLETNLDNHILDESNPHKVTKTQVGLANVENKSSATIRGEITKSNVTTALGYTPYTPNEVDNKFSALETNIDWKEAVATYNDIATTYPNPVDGWTVNVKDTDYTYRYNGTSWVAISANAIPKATNSVDGLLSKEDHTNYEDANSKKHTHSNKSVIDGITSTLVSNWNSAKTHADSTHARTDATKVEKSSTNGNIKINGTETTVYTHPSGTNPHGTTKSDVGLGNVGNFKAVSTVASQGLTDTEKSNARANIGAGTSSFSGSYNDLTNKPTIPSGEAANKGVDTSISNSSTSTNLPTSKAVASFVEGKGYKTTDNNTTYSLSKSGSTITLTGSDGSKTSVTDSSGSGGSSVSFTRNLTSGTKVGTLTIDGTNTDLYAPTDTNTTYSAGTGLSLSGTTINHKNSVTAGTAQGDASKTLAFGGTFTVPTITYDAQGHITGKGTTTMTMPANPNTDTKNTAGSTNTSSKLFLIGSTSQAANPQTYSHDTAYVGTDGCLYSNSTRVVSEVISSTEPTNQKNGDYWLQDY